MKNKIAVIFPGIGYTCDKPLLYYIIKWLRSNGVQVVTLDYTSLRKENLQGNHALIVDAIQQGMEIYERKVSQQSLTEASQVIFVGKSIGSAVAAKVYERLSDQQKEKTKLLLLTPLEETLQPKLRKDSIVFHGNQDPWANTKVICSRCAEQEITLYEVEKANHSLETGDVELDLRNLQWMIRKMIQLLEKE